jgi:mono/diheme cytochrome c family protein
MITRILYLLAAACGLIALGGAVLSTDTAEVTRGRYLVEVAGCGHCHTPGHFRGKEDHTRELGGSDVGFEVPAAGTFVGPNLTPDRETGLGRWSDQQIIVAIRGGVRPDGRLLSPVMPWQSFSRLSDADATAIVAYLRSLKPVSNRVPGPYAAGEEPGVPAWRMFVPGKSTSKTP